jgi:hypothetical protein
MNRTDEELNNRALRYAIAFSKDDSPVPLSVMLRSGMKEEYLDDFDEERNTCKPDVRSTLFGLAARHFTATGGLIDVNTLARIFREGSLALEAERLGLDPKAAAAQAEVACADARRDQTAFGSDAAPLVAALKQRFLTWGFREVTCGGLMDIGRRPTEEVIGRLIDQIHQLQVQETTERAPILSVRDSSEGRIDWYQQVQQNPARALGVPTGFTEYDRRTGGLYPGQVVLITGITKIGKSLFRDRILSNVWLSGRSVVTILSEIRGSVAQSRIECMALAGMGLKSSGNRHLSLSQALKRGSLGDAQRDAYFSMLRAFRSLPADFLLIEPTAYGRLDELEALISHLKSKHDIAALAVDDLHNQVLSQGKAERDDLRQGEVFSWLQMIAQRYELTVIAEVQEDKSTASRQHASWAEVVKYSSKLVQGTDVGIRLFRTHDAVHPEVQVLAHRHENDNNFKFRIEMDKDLLSIGDAPPWLAEFAASAPGAAETVYGEGETFVQHLNLPTATENGI